MRGLLLAAVLWVCVGQTPAETHRRFDVWRLLAPSSYVGLGIMDIDDAKAEAVGLIEPHGVEVTNVVGGSPAERAGLQRGDILLTWRGVRVEGIEHFARLVRETPVGREVELGVFRGGSERAVRVKVAERAPGILSAIGECEDCSLLTFDVPRPRIALKSRVLGAELETVDGQLAEFFGVRKGVLVRSVDRNSAAASAGFKAGDVIVAVDGKPVARTRDVSRALVSAKTEKISVELMRGRQKQTLEVEQSARRRPATQAIRRVTAPR